MDLKSLDLVRKRRKELRLSQDQLALLAGISRRPVYLLESGQGSVRLDTLLKILDVLGLEMDIQPRRPTAG